MAQQTFAYTALDAGGARRSGAVDAETRDAAIARLASEGRFVLEIRESAAGGVEALKKSSAPSTSRRPPSRQDLALFTRRLADLASAGLPLDRALAIVAEQSESATLSQIAKEALGDVRGGSSVSQALAKHPKYFDTLYTQTLSAGEASGQFGEVAERLADYLEKEVTRRGQITSALVYPCVLATVAAGVVIFLVTFVLPRLASVFDRMGSDLPITTRLLMEDSTFMVHNAIAILVVLVALIVGLRLWLSTPAGAYSRDRFVLAAPILGAIVQKATVSRFARVLGTLVYGGVPILESLEIAGHSASNRVFLSSAQAVQDEVRAGRPIAEAMRDAGGFPPVLTHMVAVGEETGDLSKMLGRVADSLDFEVDTEMRKVISLVEPVIVLTMGTIVGFVVLSVLLPIYQSGNLVR